MSVRAGSILHLAGNNVIDRIQSAGLGDARIPVETIREVGNREVVDKIPTEPDFTFSMESFNVSTELMAWLTGQRGDEASGSAPGASDPDGTEYDWLDCKFVNIPSPWKDEDSGASGVVEAGHLIPAYYPTRIRYRFGVTDNATQEVELAGGSYYYARYAPYEQAESGNGATTTFVTDYDVIPHREGGVEGTTFRYVFGVLVDGQLQTEDIDYTVTTSAAPGTPDTATIEFADAPENGADIRFCYFTDEPLDYPQSVHASTLVLPGAVRGRNIQVLIDGQRVGGVQTFEMEATIDGEVERELGNTEITGRVVNGTDANGTITVRSKDAAAFFDLMQQVTGVNTDEEVVGFFNNNEVDLQIRIENPKNPGQIIKTIRVEDAKVQPPGTPARVNQATDFAFAFESVNGTFKEIKGAPA